MDEELLLDEGPFGVLTFHLSSFSVMGRDVVFPIKCWTNATQNISATIDSSETAVL